LFTGHIRQSSRLIFPSVLCSLLPGFNIIPIVESRGEAELLLQRYLLLGRPLIEPLPFGILKSLLTCPGNEPGLLVVGRVLSYVGLCLART
jgi:hypothetical protein